MIDNSMDFNIKIELPEVVNEAIKPLAASVGTTISSLWLGVFGGADYWAQKKDLTRRSNLELFKNDINIKISNIPEHNLQEPKMSVLGPSLEASKYYFEEKHYREMFSNLIAGSCNKEYNESIHPSFVDLIKQLSSNDALILQHLNKHEDCYFADYTLLKDVNYNDNLCIMEEKVFYPNFTYIDSSKNTLSLLSLDRFNLISYESGYRGDGVRETIGSFYEEDPLFNTCVNKYNQTYIKQNFQGNDYEAKDEMIVLLARLELSTLGKVFVKVCT